MEEPSPAVEVRVATADGAGVGRFVAAALREALEGGGGLGVGVSLEQPAYGSSGVDFVFARASGVEVIRVGLDRAHQVVSAELLRSTSDWVTTWAQAMEHAALLEALGTGEIVAELRWHQSAKSADSLEILVRKDSRISVAVRTSAQGR